MGAPQVSSHLREGHGHHYRMLPHPAAQRPTGGNLEDVVLKKTMVASTDPVALCACVAKAFWSLDPEHLSYLQMAANSDLGTVEFDTLQDQPTEVRRLAGSFNSSDQELRLRRY